MLENADTIACMQLVSFLLDAALSVLIAIAVGLPLSIYAGIIVARFIEFRDILNRAKNLVLSLEQDWVYYLLPEPVFDPHNKGGYREEYMSEIVETNSSSWQLMQLGLAMKEIDHWGAASAIDTIWMKLDELRENFISEASNNPQGHTQYILKHIAEWHRVLTCQQPNWMPIIQPWPANRKPMISCVEVDEMSGEWNEIEPND